MSFATCVARSRCSPQVSVESPAKKWPGAFEKMPIFVKYPYLLPCCVAATVLATGQSIRKANCSRSNEYTGAFLSLFLAPDCGPREGAIQLPPEKLTDIPEEESRPPTPHFDNTEERSGTFGSIRSKLSGFLGKRPAEPLEAPQEHVQPPVPLTETPSRAAMQRAASRISRVSGSAYGYSGSSYRNRIVSPGTMASRRGSVAASLRRRRESNHDGTPSSMGTGADLNFAQRLLMANENAVTNIADLWVAAAINADNEDLYEASDAEFDGDLYADDDDAVEEELDDEVFAGPSTPRHNRFSRRHSAQQAHPSSFSHRQSPSSFRGPLLRSPPRRQSFTPHRVSDLRRESLSSAQGTSSDVDELPMRRASTHVPSIFAHVGVRTPPAVLEAQQLLAQVDVEAAYTGGTGPDTLAPVPESRLPSRTPSPAPSVREPSLMSMLPIAIILQYGWLALHSTTHDQVFYLYLVS